MFEVLDHKIDLEITISKIISEQGTKNLEELDLAIAELFTDQEIVNYDETDNEISKLIPTIGQEEEEEEQKEPGKPSIFTHALILMSFLNEVSDKLLSSAGRNLRFGCPQVEKCLEPTDDSSNEVLNRDNVELSPSSAQANATL